MSCWPLPFVKWVPRSRPPRCTGGAMGQVGRSCQGLSGSQVPHAELNALVKPPDSILTAAPKVSYSRPQVWRWKNQDSERSREGSQDRQQRWSRFQPCCDGIKTRQCSLGAVLAADVLLAKPKCVSFYCSYVILWGVSPIDRSYQNCIPRSVGAIEILSLKAILHMYTFHFLKKCRWSCQLFLNACYVPGSWGGSMAHRQEGQINGHEAQTWWVFWSPAVVSLEEGPLATGARGSDFKNKYSKTFLFDYRRIKIWKIHDSGVKKNKNHINFPDIVKVNTLWISFFSLILVHFLFSVYYLLHTYVNT